MGKHMRIKADGQVEGIIRQLCGHFYKLSVPSEVNTHWANLDPRES